jgi:SAM-dependent methyltransferase
MPGADTSAHESPQYDVRDYLIWDVESWLPALRFWEKRIDWERVHRCLELGANKGGLSLWLGVKGKSVVCSDLENTKDKAQRFHSPSGVGALISYEDIDATNIPYTDYFDIVIFKSLLGAVGRNGNIENQRKAFRQIHKALKKGGSLLFAENLLGSLLHQILRDHFVSWGKSWRYVTIDEVRQFLSLYDSFVFETTGVLGDLGLSERQRNMLAIVDKVLLNRICPDDWKYIIYGVAQK